MNATRFILAASMVLAMALAISCSSGENEGGDTQSSSSSDVVSSSSLNIVSSSSLNTVSSSSSNIVPSSSSNAVSSSSLDDVSSSSLNDASSSSSSKCDVVNGSFTDTRNNKNYNTVKICEQTWMAENLNFEASSGSACYDNEESNCEIYGRLYKWETSKSVCPDGWHLPSEDEWDILNDYAGGYDIDGTAGKNLRATSGWNRNGNGLDIYGFTAFPGGYSYSNGAFLHIGDYGYWWSSTDKDNYTAVGRCIDYHATYPYPDDKRHSFSVRCIQDLIPQQ